CKSPIEATVPGDGVYGFYLVVTNGAGIGKKPPQSGDAPQMTVEVDTKLPTAELYSLRMAPDRRDALLLTWSASDKNLTAAPISLYWAERIDQPGGTNWQPIATDQPNTNSGYVWPLPPNIPPKVFLRLVVKDLAGNASIADTPEPQLIDLVEPTYHLK